MKPSSRLAGLDLLRGMVILLMSLDHARDFFQPTGTNPTNLETTSLALFFTRWATHLCAPVFVFVAGVSMALQWQKRGSPSLRRFFVTRGLWLMFLEVTWVTFSWYFAYPATHLGILWGIGGAMILAAPFCGQSPYTQAAIGSITLLVIEAFEMPTTGLIAMLVRPGTYVVADHPIYSVYVLVPWWAVVLLGMASARWLTRAGDGAFVKAGTMALTAFLALRALNVADPSPWQVQERGALFTALSFLDVSKYPPSIAFLCVTLGTAFLLGGALCRCPASVRGVIQTYGRVPLFYYLLHLPLLHLGGTLYAQWRVGADALPRETPLSLGLIYGACILGNLLLWIPVRAYDARKRSKPQPWMRFL